MSKSCLVSSSHSVVGSWNTRFLESLWVKCGTASKAVKKWSQDEGNGNDFVMTSLRGGVFENKDFLNLASLGSWVIPKSCGFGRQDAGPYRQSYDPRLQTTNRSSAWCCTCTDQKKIAARQIPTRVMESTFLTDLPEGGCTCCLRMWFSLITQILTSQRNLFRRQCIYLKACYAFWGPFN